MNDLKSVKKAASTVSNARHAKALVDRLRGKVNHFAVLDTQGGLIGEVQDLVLDPSETEGNFNLAVIHPTPTGNRTLLISSALLRKIDIPNRTFFTKLSEAEVEHLPEHQSLDTSESRELAELTSTEKPQELSLVGVPQGEVESSGEFDPFPPEGLQGALETMPPAADALPDTTLSATEPARVIEEVVRTLEEKLILNRSKRKAGEVIVRKEVETRMVEVPVRYEKLIIEQIGTDIGAETRQLAAIDLGKGEVIGVEFADASDSTYLPRVKGEFATPAAASHVLDMIAKTLHHRCKQVNIEILLGGWDVQKTYHEFPSPRLAGQMLEAIAKALPHRCNQVNVELLVENSQIQRTYQEWFEQFQSQNS
jgi:stress response protein YsnF/sporulation protein YlmC with PRC-barrel domain